MGSYSESGESGFVPIELLAKHKEKSRKFGYMEESWKRVIE